MHWWKITRTPCSTASGWNARRSSLIFGKPSIVSEHTGTAGLITEGVDGFVYRDDDPDQLAKVLEHAILHPDQLAAMKADCRKMYEKYYSNEAYVATLTRLVNELTT